MVFQLPHKVTPMGVILCFCDRRKLVIVVFARHKCDVRAYVRCRRAWRGLKGSCPQMTCRWHGLCQTGRQVALGSHSRTWVFEPCCTNPQVHTNTGPSTPKAGWVTKMMCLGGGLALCMLQAGNCFPKERKNKDYKRERSISVYFVCSVCLNNCSWHKSKKHSQVFASRRRVSPRMDCSQIFCTPIQSWISVCEGSKGGGRVASLRSRQHYTQVPEGVAPT